MLHVGSRTVAAERMDHHGADNIVTLAEAFSFFRRHPRIIAGTTAAFLIVAGVYVVAVPPTYVASSKILIESQGMRPTWQEFGADVNVDSTEVESQAEVLRSSSVTQEVIRVLGLTANPQFVNRSDMHGLRVATSVVQEHLNVHRVGQSNAIEVAFAWSSPTMAARVVNEIVSAYLRGGWRNEARPDTFRRFNEDLNRESLAVRNALVITAASPPLRKSTPKTSLILALALVSGLLSGFGAALCFDRLDRRIRSLSQIGSGHNSLLLSELPIAERPNTSNSNLAFTAIERPWSKFGDGLRSIKSTLDATADRSGEKCIGVCPIAAGAGATTIATNLAALYARSGKRVLLLDADFGNRSLTGLLAPHATKGLVELVLDQEDDCFIGDERHGFTVLPLTNSSRVANAAIFLRSAAMTALLRQARAEFDIVLVDLPPSLDVIDGNFVGLTLERMIFVAEYGKTLIEELTAAIDCAGNLSNNVILNKSGHPALLMQLRTAQQWLKATSSRAPPRNWLQEKQGQP